MDVFSAGALLIGVLLLIAAGSVLAISGSRALPTFNGSMLPSTYSILGVASTTAQTTGSWMPYMILLGGPIADLLTQDFRYTIMTAISAIAMVVGFVFQIVFYGGIPRFLPALTVGTSAALMYLIQDAWNQPQLSMEKRALTTIGASTGMVLTALVSMGSGGMFTTPYLNELVSIVLGAGIGELAWAFVWSTMPDRLPLVNK
jgi:uncharacterized membrane protein